MMTGNLAHQCQPQANALVYPFAHTGTAIEGVKDAFLLLFGNTRPTIQHKQFGVIFFFLEFDLDGRACSVAACVLQQISHHATQ